MSRCKFIVLQYTENSDSLTILKYYWPRHLGASKLIIIYVNIFIIGYCFKTTVSRKHARKLEWIIFIYINLS